MARPRGRPRKNREEIRAEEIKDVPQAIKEIAETFEEEERELLAKLAKKYKNAEPTERKPGKVVQGVKTIWTYGDMVKEFPIISFVPEETIPLTWQGVKTQAYAGIEMHVPRPFYDLYRQHRAALRRPVPAGIEVGIGALEED